MFLGHCGFCHNQYTDGCKYCSPNYGWIELPIGESWELTTEGWECPVCGRGNAPTLETCPCFREKNKNGGQ